jgi:hypothetical protein
MSNTSLPWFIVVFFFLIGGVLCVGRTDAGEAAFFAAALIVTTIVSAVAVKDAQANLFEQKAKYAQYLIQLDPQGRNMLWYDWPTLEFSMANGFPEIEVKGTGGVKLEYFKKFLLASNSSFVVAERIYSDKSIARNQWSLWIDYLLSKGYVIEDRKMNEAYRWINGEQWQKLKFLYIEMRQPPVLSRKEAEIPAGTKAIPVEDNIERAFV